jgi:dihydropteroate synthase
VIVTPLASHSPAAVREALRAHGWDPALAADTALGVAPAAFHIQGLDPAAAETLVRYGGRLGLEVLTGEGWAVLAGSRSRLSAFARPWGGPPELAEAATHVGLAMPAEPPRHWRTAGPAIMLDRPVIAGILNVTPDSFSDGGRFAAPDAALARAERLLADGASIVDVGGESTRPGALPVTAADECDRVVPVIAALAGRFPGVALSIDTTKAAVARAALDAGAAIINDVSGLRLDPAMAAVAAERGAGLVLMHSRGSFGELASYAHASYPGGVIAEVVGELRSSLQRARDAGVADEQVVLDPGFGFSKTVEQNILLLDQLAALAALGRPLLAGPSRKRFLGTVAGLEAGERDGITAVACALAWERGARLFRVHEPAPARAALALAEALGGP